MSRLLRSSLVSKTFGRDDFPDIRGSAPLSNPPYRIPFGPYRWFMSICINIIFRLIKSKLLSIDDSSFMVTLLFSICTINNFSVVISSAEILVDVELFVNSEGDKVICSIIEEGCVGFERKEEYLPLLRILEALFHFCRVLNSEYLRDRIEWYLMVQMQIYMPTFIYIFMIRKSLRHLHKTVPFVGPSSNLIAWTTIWP